ncbi:MAG: hypothetical protein KGJ06_07470 [Pseudomonadota bacterium]|nr:hypothetical protein [Pseudomonadota bacterium]
MTQWTTNTLPSGSVRPSPEDLDKSVVLLLYGKNSFGDKIYSYLKITIRALDNLKEAVISGKPFTPSDFGTVIAAGKGEPTDEVRSEVNNLYQVFESQQPRHHHAAAISAEKKKWDEY